MKLIKVIAGLGLIPLGIFIGSFISLGTGNGAILGGVLGIILSCIIWFVPALVRFYQARRAKPDEQCG